MKSLQFLILLLFLSIAGKSQPSYMVQFHFRLFDEKGQIVDYNIFCREYKMLGELDRNDQTACLNENLPKEYTYNEQTKFFNGSGTVVYNDLMRTFIHGKDTMVLILLTDNGRAEPYEIDSLYMKPGKYVISDNKLKRIYFQKAELDYYNYILEWVAGIKKQILNYQDADAYKELCRLKRKYNISMDDDSKKTVGDLFNLKK